MRRFWAFFTLLFSVVLAVGLIGQPVLESADVSNEFESGSVIQYKISLPENSSETSLRNIDVASEINERLDTAGIRGSSVEIYWPDDSFMQEEATVRISFPTQSQSELASFRRILEGSGELTISTTNTSADEIMTGDEFFADPVATVEYDENNAPYVALHVVSDEAWNTMSDRASADSSADDGGSDGSEDTSPSMYIWRNFDPDTDSYDKAFSDDEDVYDATVEDKLVFSINTSMYDSDTRIIKISQDNSWDVSSSRVPWAGKGTSEAWDITSARAMVESLNAADYDFDISYTFTSTAPATIGESALTWIWVGFVAAFLVLAIGMIARFGAAGALSSVSAAVSVLVTLFIGTGLGFEISTAAFVGLAVTAILSILVNVNYFTRVYSELRKGRDVVKANREGYHKSYVATVDICLSALVISLFSFLIGRDLMKVAFGFILIGAICAFLFGNYLTHWLMYWLTSAWSKASPRAIFGFNSRDAKVGEPPLYDATAEAAPADQKAPAKISRSGKGAIASFSAVAGALTAACCLTLGILAGVSGTGSLFNYSGSYADSFTISFSTLGTSYVSSETGRDVEFTDGASFTEYLRDSVIYPALDSFRLSDDLTSFDTVDDFLEGTYLSLDQMEFNMVEIDNDSGQDNSTFYVIYGSYSMPAASGIQQEYRMEAVTEVIQKGIEKLSDASQNPAAASNISIAHSFVNDTLEERYEPSFSFGETQPGYREHSDVFMFIGLACMVCFVAIYAGLRYGLAAGITQFVISLFGGALGLAAFALLRLPFTFVVGYGLLGGTLISGVSLLPFYSRNRDILREHKSYRTAKLSERMAAADYASRLTWLSVGFTAVGSAAFAVLSLAMYGSSVVAGMGIAFGLSAIGSVVCGGILTPILYPVLRSKLSFRTWSERLAAVRARRGKKRKVIVADPNEAHETVIPGLNDYRSW